MQITKVASKWMYYRGALQLIYICICQVATSDCMYCMCACTLLNIWTFLITIYIFYNSITVIKTTVWSLLYLSICLSINTDWHFMRHQHIQIVLSLLCRLFILILWVHVVSLRKQVWWRKKSMYYKEKILHTGRISIKTKSNSNMIVCISWITISDANIKQQKVLKLFKK